MNDQYPIGTICIYQNLDGPYAYKNGKECEIVEPLERRYVQGYSGRFKVITCYMVQDAEGIGLAVPPEKLRKPKEPPKQSDSQWADEKVRKLKKQSSDYVVIGKPELIPEEMA